MPDLALFRVTAYRGMDTAIVKFALAQGEADARAAAAFLIPEDHDIEHVHRLILPPPVSIYGYQLANDPRTVGEWWTDRCKELADLTAQLMGEPSESRDAEAYRLEVEAKGQRRLFPLHQGD